MKHSFPKSTSGSTPHCSGLLHSTPSTQLQALNTTSGSTPHCSGLRHPTPSTQLQALNKLSSGSTPHCRGLLHSTPSTQLQALNTTSGSTPHCRGLLHSISKHSTPSSQHNKWEYTPLQGSSPINFQASSPLNSQLQALNSKLSTQQAGVHPQHHFLPRAPFFEAKSKS